MLRIQILFMVLLAGFSAAAQQYNYRNFTVADGLPSNMVYDVQQDSEGFIWAATDAGVARFDGRKFTVFTQQDGLPSNDVIVLYPDSKGRMWMITNHNSMCYYHKGRFYSYRNDSLLKQIRPFSNFFFVMENDAGDMAFIAHESNTPALFVLTANNRVIHKKLAFEIRGYSNLQAGSNPHEFFFSLYDSSQQRIDTYTFDNENWQHFYSVKWGTSPDYYHPYKMVDGKLVQQDSVYYPGCGKLMFRAFADMDRLFFSPSPPDRIKVVCSVNKGRTARFHTTENGVYMVDPVTIETIDHLIPGINTNRAIMDNEDNIWIGTASEGLVLIPNRNVKSYTFHQPQKEILSIFKTGNQLLAGNSNGDLYTINESRITKTVFGEFFSISNNKGEINRLRYIEPVGNKHLGLGFDNFTIKYDLVTGQKIFRKIDVNKAIAPAGKDSFIMATGRGTLLVDENFTILDSIWKYRSYSCIRTNQAYYIGSPNGLIKITRGHQPFIMANAIPELQTLVTKMCIDPLGDLWIATAGNGIFKLRNDKLLVQYNINNGMVSNNCKSMFLDNKFLWVGTEKGLHRINWRNPSEPIQLYTTEDGLPSNDIYSIFSDSSRLFVGTTGKLTSFDTSLIRLHSFCKLILLEAQAGNRTYHIDSFHRIRYDENTVKFNFTGISFRSSGNITYHYRLKGFSESWNTTSNTNLEFVALPHGDYELQIFARNKFGVVSNTISRHFTITAPFWKTWWFRISVVSIFISLVWWLINRRIRQEQAKSATQNRINELEQLALRSQMNPHFIFNCLNSIQNFLLHSNFEKTNEYLTSFAHLIRQTLDNSSRSSISLENECRYLSSYLELESMRFAHSFVYDIEVDPDIDTNYTFIPTMILQPYVENSIRHGLRYRQDGAKSVKVIFRKRGNTLVCIVEDNGIGRKRSAEMKSFIHVEYQSKGMTLTAERIAALNRQQDIPITVDVIDMEDDGNATGTQVIVRIPNVFL